MRNLILVLLTLLALNLNGQCVCDLQSQYGSLPIDDRFDSRDGWYLESADPRIVVRKVGNYHTRQEKRARVIATTKPIQNPIDVHTDTIRFLVRPTEKLIVLRDVNARVDYTYIISGVDHICVVINCGTDTKQTVAYRESHNRVIAEVNNETSSIRLRGVITTAERTVRDKILMHVQHLKSLSEWDGYRSTSDGFFCLDGTLEYANLRERLKDKNMRRKYQCTPEQLVAVLYNDDRDHTILTTEGITIVSRGAVGQAQYKHIKWVEINSKHTNEEGKKRAKDKRNTHSNYPNMIEGSVTKFYFFKTSDNNRRWEVSFRNCNLTAKEIQENFLFLINDIAQP